MTMLFSASVLTAQADWEPGVGGWHYTVDGTAVTGWVELGGKWYLFGEDGSMKTGWQLDGDTYYYLNPNGDMAVNEWVGDYYLTGSGAMAVNTWIAPGYYVGSDGAWIPRYTQPRGGAGEVTYLVGADVPAGEYVVYSTSSFAPYYAVYRDNSLKQGSMIQNDYVLTANSIITVEDGNYLQLGEDTCIAPIQLAQLDTTGEGVYKVGTHLVAGMYTLRYAGKYAGLSAKYIVYTDNSQGADKSAVLRGTLKNGETVTVTLSDGQYLSMNNVEIVK